MPSMRRGLRVPCCRRRGAERGGSPSKPWAQNGWSGLHRDVSLRAVANRPKLAQAAVGGRCRGQ